jgi:amino acid adenylation domain-containing protein
MNINIAADANPSAIRKRELLAELLCKRASEQIVKWPLSRGQKALWFLHQSDPQSFAYHVGSSLRIRSLLDVAALRRACQALVDRHGMLRASFHMRDGEAVQQIAGYQFVAFEEIDAAGWDEATLYRNVRAVYERAFDLAARRAFRVALFTRAPDDHVLLLTVHHLVYDGWSLWLNLDELQRFYAAEVGGRPAALPRVARSYRDYMEKQETMLAGPEGERLWNFWKNELAGPLPVLNLPTDRPRPPVQTFHGASHPFALDPELSASIRNLAQTEGVTTFRLLLAAFLVFLHRYSGQDDILVGFPTSGREDAAFTPTVGYFVNPVVLRADLSGNPAFKALLEQVRETLQRALAHQEFPFPLLVERLRQKRDPSHAPVFQVSFAFQKTQQAAGILDLVGAQPDKRIQWGGLEIEHYNMPQQEGQFDLELEMADTGAPLFGVFKYNRDLFDAATIARWTDSFAALLRSIADEPTRPVDHLPLLSEADRRWLLESCGGRPDRHLEVETLHAGFEKQVNRTPDAIALVHGERRLTYDELNRKANAVARHLRTMGVAPGTLVGLCVESSVEMMVGLLGIIKAGGAYVPLDPALPRERLAFIVADSAVPVLVSQAALAEDMCDSGPRLVLLDSDWSAIAAHGSENLANQVDIDDVVYVIYTSGTTGKPKGVQVTHRNVARLLAATAPWYGFNSSDVWPLFHSFAFDVSVWEMWNAFLYGGRLVVVPHSVSRSPNEFLALLVNEGVTVLNQTPSAFRLLLQADGWRNPPRPLALRYVIFAGEALDIQSLRPWFERYGDAKPVLVNMYGITETTVHATYCPLRLSDLASTRNMVGIPIPDLRIYILDQYREPMPIGVAGEIYVGGDGVARGYLRRPELDSARFIRDPFSDQPGAHLYKSGDAARRVDGEIEYIGRLDNQVKIRGYRIELGEIETVLGQHPAVSAAIVRMQEIRTDDKRLVAYVVSKDGAAPSATVLRQFLKSKLPDYMVPATFIAIDKLPLTGNGKIDYRALPAPETGTRDAQALVPPRDDIEQRLTQLWEEALKVKPIGVRDNFFELGGHSIMAVYLMAQVERHFGKAMPLASLFRNPTIEQFGELLRTDTCAASWSPLVSIQPSGSARPFFCVAGGGGNVLYFYRLAHRLPKEQPFYGLQSLGLDGSRAPLSRVEDIAAESLRAVRQIQPHGPYHLGGHCFGAWVAFEMAQQLRRHGEEVALLVVLDAPAPRPDLMQLGEDVDDDAFWIAKLGAAMGESAGIDLGIDHARLSALDAQARLNHFGECMQRAGVLPPGAGLGPVRGLLGVFVANSKARYAPQDVRKVPIALFRAGEFHREYDYSPADDPGHSPARSTLGWRDLAHNEIPVHVVGGNHITMMSEPHVGELAERVAAHLSDPLRARG